MSFLLARGLDGLNRVAAEIWFRPKTHVFSVDLADPQATAAAYERIKREVGVPDVIFNNAGVGALVCTWKKRIRPNCSK